MSEHANPVGSREELEALGVNLVTHASCSQRERDPDTGNVTNLGCKHFRNCVFSHKGKRPENYAVRLLKKGYPQNELEMACFLYMDREMDWNRVQGSGNFAEIIVDAKHPKGGPGTKYFARGTKQVDKQDNGKINTIHQDHVQKAEVKPFPPANENLALVQSAYMGAVTQRRMDERRVRQADEAAGMASEEAPSVGVDS